MSGPLFGGPPATTRARTRRLAALWLALLLPTAVVWHGRQSDSLPPPTPASLGLPDRVGPWQLIHEQGLDDEVWQQVQPDFHTLRLYRAPGRNPVAVYVGLYRGRAARQAAHDPRACYPAQGWEILAEFPVRVPLALGDGAEALWATGLRLERNTAERDALYWFQSAGRWPGQSWLEQLHQLASALANRPQYAFVRLSTVQRTEADTEADLRDFAAALAPSVRAVVDVLPEDEGEHERQGEPARLASRPSRRAADR